MSGKLSGGAGHHGGDYQIQLYMLFLIRGYEKNVTFHLRAEDKKAGKFDDLIYEDNSEIILLQAKHKTNQTQNISAVKIFAEKGEFSLFKYLESYIQTRLKFPNATYVICSNIGFNDELSEIYTKKMYTGTTSMLYYVQNSYQYVYSFETDKTIIELKEKQSEVDLRTILNFLRQLRFIMLKDEDIKTVIEEAIPRLITFDPNLTAKATYDFIFNKLKSWFNEKKLTNLSNLHLDGYLSEMSSGAFLDNLRQHNNKLTFLDIPIRPDRQIIIIKTSRYLVVMVKLYLQMFQGHEETVLFINPELMSKQESIINTFKLERFTHLVFRIQSERTLLDTLENVLNIITNKKYAYKKIIVLTENFFSLNCKQRVYKTADNRFYKDVKITESIKGNLIRNKEFYISRQLVRFHSDELYTEDKLLNETLRKPNEIVLISDVPGMGKSTVLSKFMGIINETSENVWPIKIDLNSHSQLFKDCIKKNKPLELEDLLDFSSEMETYEKQVTSIPGIILLMLDGLDEISYEHINVLLNFIKNNNSTYSVKKIIITARPHVADHLEQEKSLDVKIFKFIPLTNSQQYDCIYEYWIQNFKITDGPQKEKCKQYGKVLLEKLSSMITDLETLIGVPLLVKILSDIFEPQAKAYCCAAVSINDNDPRNDIHAAWNLAQLYEKFMETKKQIFVEEKSDTRGNKFTTEAASKQFDDCVSVCENLALTIFFPQEICNFFEAKTILQEVPDSLCDIGIIIKYKEKWNFVHRTFAEYLVAKKMFKEINSCNSERVKYLIQHIFLENYNVNSFLNSILEAEWNNLDSKVFRTCAEQLVVIYREGNVTLKYLITYDYLHILKLLLDKCDISEAIITAKETELLHLAVACGHIDIVKYLVEKGVQVDYKDECGRTALHYCGKVDVAEYLIKMGADINSSDDKHNSVLCSVTIRDHVDVVQHLVNNGANINFVNDEGFSVLHFSVYRPYVNMVDEENSFTFNNNNIRTPVFTRSLNSSANYGNPKLVEILIKKGAKVNAKNKAGNSVLHRAVHGDNVGIVKLLVENGADVNARNNDGDSVLHLAVYVGCLDIVKHLVEKGANINARDNDGDSVLHLAACEDNLEVIKYFITLNSDINATNNEDVSVLHAAAHVGIIDIVTFLIDNGADINAQDRLGDSVLCRAISSRKDNVVKYLIDKGANIHHRNDFGDSVLHEAVQCGNIGIFKYLVERGANVNTKSYVGNPVIHLVAASTAFHPLPLLKYLVGKGADINDTDENGQSVLHISAANVIDTINVAKYLVENGANVNAKDKEGKSVLHVAAANAVHGLNLVRYLVENGADVNARDYKGASVKTAAAVNSRTVQYLVDKGAMY